MNPLVALAIRETPAFIEGIKALFAKHHPDQPAPTDDEVKAACRQAIDSSLAKDEAWQAAHPDPSASVQ